MAAPATPRASDRPASPSASTSAQSGFPRHRQVAADKPRDDRLLLRPDAPAAERRANCGFQEEHEWIETGRGKNGRIRNRVPPPPGKSASPKSRLGRLKTPFAALRGFAVLSRAFSFESPLQRLVIAGVFPLRHDN